MQSTEATLPVTNEKLERAVKQLERSMDAIQKEAARIEEAAQPKPWYHVSNWPFDPILWGPLIVITLFIFALVIFGKKQKKKK